MGEPDAVIENVAAVSIATAALAGGVEIVGAAIVAVYCAAQRRAAGRDR
jgi:hypothetical protein